MINGGGQVGVKDSPEAKVTLDKKSGAWWAQGGIQISERLPAVDVTCQPFLIATSKDLCSRYSVVKDSNATAFTLCG